MSFEETFSSDLGSYVEEVTNDGTVIFDGTTGNPNTGCAKTFASFINPTYSTAYLKNEVDTHLVAAGEDLYFNARFVSNISFESNFVTQIFHVRVEFSDAAALDALYLANSLLGASLDSGWLQFNIDLSTREGKTIDYIHFGNIAALTYQSVDTQEITQYIDSAEFATTPPPFSPTPELSGYGFTHSAGGIPGSVLVL